MAQNETKQPGATVEPGADPKDPGGQGGGATPPAAEVPKFESADDFGKFLQSTTSTAKNDMLKALGVKSVKEAKEKFKKLGELEKAALSESEKAQLTLKEKDTALAEANSKLAMYEARDTLKDIIKPEFSDWVYYQFKDEPDLKAAAEAFVKANPQYAKDDSAKPNVKTFGKKNQGKPDSDFDGPIATILAEKHNLK